MKKKNHKTHNEYSPTEQDLNVPHGGLRILPRIIAKAHLVKVDPGQKADVEKNTNITRVKEQGND